jgi:cell wall assembly regulator SMI1
MLKEHIEFLESLLKRKVSEDRKDEYETYKQINGATDQDLDNFEERIGIKLPKDFREFYKYKNGSGYHFHILYTNCDGHHIEPFYLYSLDEIIEEKETYFNEDELMNEFYDEDELQGLDKRIKPYFRNKKWIPFAALAGGSLYLMLDFNPTDDGKEGQIISFVHDPDFVHFVQENFTDLLKHSNENLDQNWGDIEY